MGTWDKLPWDNDAAADWFAQLLEKRNSPNMWRTPSSLEVEKAHDGIRAATSVLLFLGRDYVWPVHDLDRPLALAAERLEQVSRVAEIAASPELLAEIHAEVQELLGRIKTNGSPQPNLPEARKWWQFWT
jgi:hypothetical protein